MRFNKFFCISLVALLLLCGCSGENTDSSYSDDYSSDSDWNYDNDYSSKSSENYYDSSSYVECSMCNGAGRVKYYYGESSLDAALNGYDDYEYGPCTSCDSLGYITVHGKRGNSDSDVICPSCEEYVSGIVTRSDNAGVVRKWCSSCWSSYDSIMEN